jgi:hypothetical protein
MEERRPKPQRATIILLTIGAIIALPFLVLFAALAEERWLGSHEISSFAHRVGLKDMLNELYWLIFGDPA